MPSYNDRADSPTDSRHPSEPPPPYRPPSGAPDGWRYPEKFTQEPQSDDRRGQRYSPSLRGYGSDSSLQEKGFVGHQDQRPPSNGQSSSPPQSRGAAGASYPSQQYMQQGPPSQSSFPPGHSHYPGPNYAPKSSPAPQNGYNNHGSYQGPAPVGSNASYYGQPQNGHHQQHQNGYSYPQQNGYPHQPQNGYNPNGQPPPSGYQQQYSYPSQGPPPQQQQRPQQSPRPYAASPAPSSLRPPQASPFAPEKQVRFASQSQPPPARRNSGGPYDHGRYQQSSNHLSAPQRDEYDSDRSRDRSRERRHERDYERPHHRHRHSSENPNKKDKSSVSTFLGAGGGALIGDAIFPGLGTVGGALLGGYGGHEYKKKKKRRGSDSDYHRRGRY